MIVTLASATAPFSSTQLRSHLAELEDLSNFIQESIRVHSRKCSSPLACCSGLSIPWRGRNLSISARISLADRDWRAVSKEWDADAGWLLGHGAECSYGTLGLMPDTYYDNVCPDFGEWHIIVDSGARLQDFYGGGLKVPV